MTSLTKFFNIDSDASLKGITHKNNIIKRNIIAYMAVNGECTLSELTRELHISVPTMTKLVQELVDEKIVNDLGKVETPGGRRPNVFGLANSAIYFAGVNVGRDNMRFLITDLQNNIIKEENDFTFELQDRPQCMERICTSIEELIATCGIDRKLTFHMARHTYATEITLSHGVPMETVSRMLGHTNIKTTQIYAKVTDDMLAKGFDEMADIYSTKYSLAR